MIKVFWLEPTGQVRVRLRRYRSGGDCGAGGYCNASCVILDSAPAEEWTEEVDSHPSGRKSRRSRDELVQATDPRWPAACEKCGRAFDEGDWRQLWTDDLHSGAPDGWLYTLRNAPVGAMWDAWWMDEWHRGPDGICLVVKTPGGDWMVDGEASNCTRPHREERDGRTYRTARTHHCWVRHGDPRTGDVHVDKAGNTCAAGAGSIMAGSYHGFLHHGHLT